MSDMIDKFNEITRKRAYEFPDPRLINAVTCEYVTGAINLIVTDTYDDLYKFILSSALNVQWAKNEYRQADNILHIDIANCVDENKPNFMMNDDLHPHHYKRVNISDIDSIYGTIKEFTTHKSIVIITNLEKMTFHNEDPNNEWIYTARASMISQLFRHLLPMISNSESILIVGHKSEGYETFIKGSTEIKPTPGKHIPETPINSLICLSSTISKVTKDNGVYNVVPVLNKLKM